MVGRCVVVTRELRGGSRIVETERAFTSVEELFAFCVGLQNPNIVDRLSISGRDADGRALVLTFSLESVSAPALLPPRERG
jgi:hypothetical protein